MDKPTTQDSATTPDKPEVEPDHTASIPITEAPATTPVSAPRKSSLRPFVLGIVAAIILIGAGVGGTLFYQSAINSHPGITPHQTVKNDGNALTTASETTIAAVAKKASPSVVSIVTQIQDQSSIWSSGGTEEAAGSGIVVSSNGIILTNKHVVSGANKVQVILSDGTTYNDVTVIGTDPLNDLAFLKVNGVNNLTAATLGDSSTINIGQEVVAIGNSLGEYQNTVTSGIISGLGRPLTAQNETGSSTENLNDLIQTDAAINPGNSGGPLLNSAGQVIGINTAVAQDAQGIGFSIPINSAKGILKGLLAGGTTIKRSYLGVRYIPVNAAVEKQYKLSVSEGAYVYATGNQPAVVSGSPADKAGIKSGDVITKVNDVEVGPHGDVSSLISEYAPGDTIDLTINRGGQTQTVTVTLAVYTGNGS